MDIHYSGTNLKIGHAVLFEIWRKQKSPREKEEAILNFMSGQIEFSILELNKTLLKTKAKTFCLNVSKKWIKCKRVFAYFSAKHEKWMEGSLSFNLIQIESKPKSTRKLSGRPTVPFWRKTARSKRQQAINLSTAQEHNFHLLVQAGSIAARRRGLLDLAFILKLLDLNVAKAKHIRKLISKPVKQPVRCSADEALALLLDQGLTKEQYCAFREDTKSRDADIYPFYKKVAEKKKDCRPPNILITETTAQVPLEDLLNHTVARIVAYQKENIAMIMNDQQTDFLSTELILSYGFDGSTGQANYNQAYTDGQSYNADSSLFVTTVMPLRLIDFSGNVLWNNRTPQSIRFCRPLKLEFLKESKAVIIAENLRMQEEIQNLIPCKISLNEKQCIYVKFTLHLTAIDGKVLNALTNTNSSQACPICKATPKDFQNNKHFKCLKFVPLMDNIKYGVSPLHCWIRFFEFILHAGYKIDVKKWRISNPADKITVSQKKKLIQRMFWEKLSLKVDRPKQGGFGSTNVGNTSRRAFNNYKEFSEITGIDEQLIFNMRTILICLSCQLPINLHKFEQLCHITGELIVDKYPWLPMTATVHKILVHSTLIMENTVLPVGYFGEEAAESRNKIYKSDRLHHARKHSRLCNFTDVFHRSMDTSDPIISSVNLQKRILKHKRLALPSEVIQILACEYETGDEPSEDADFEDEDVNDYLYNIEIENEDYIE